MTWKETAKKVLLATVGLALGAAIAKLMRDQGINIA